MNTVLFIVTIVMKNILVPHFYRLNWAREMSEFLRSSDGFEYLGKDFEYGNYSKAGKLKDQYLNYLLDNVSQYEGRTLFFVNLNDYIFFERREELKSKFKIMGFMRGSRFFDGEPGNCAFDTDNLAKMKNLESLALQEVDRLFLGSDSFSRFLLKNIPELDTQKIKVVGIPIFIEPCYLGKNDSQIAEFKKGKSKNLLIWNHRLQKQKNPWVLFQLERFVKSNLSICTPEALSAAYSKEMKEHESIFRNIIRDNGKKRNLYLDELKNASFVLSTSEHETWGNSMIEGIMNGAVPIAPDGECCSYRELFSEEFLYPQSLIKKEKNIITREDNIIQLSYIIDEAMRRDKYVELKNLQQSLWDKFNKETWSKRLMAFIQLP